MAKRNAKRPDQNGVHRGMFERNKRKIYATQTVCGICGRPVDFSLKYPHPLSPCIDHIIPIAKGGHPSDLSNLQLAHWTCNRQKSDKLIERRDVKELQTISNRVLPQSMVWRHYRPAKADAAEESDFETKEITKPEQSESKDKVKTKQKISL
jgi:hypothetical protein